MILEDAAARSLLLNPPIFPDFSVASREGEESVRRALEEFQAGVGSHAERWAEETSEGETSFIDIVDGIERETGGESEGFTFADIPQRADLLSETLLKCVVDTAEQPVC